MAPLNAKSIICTLKPNVASLGYALFLAINAAAIWGGVFPFLPVEFQTLDLMFAFFLAQSVACLLSYLASTVGLYLFPKAIRAYFVKLAAIPYFLGWVCLIASMYLDNLSLLLAIAGGALLGLGSSWFYTLWQRLFASQSPDIGNRDLMVGTIWAAPIYFSLHLLPTAVATFLIPFVFLPLFGLAIVLKSREMNMDQAMFSDIPREHPRVYRAVLRDYARSAVCIGALAFCTGIMRSIIISSPQAGTLVNILSMLGMAGVAIVLLVLWQFRDIHFNMIKIYRSLFPLMTTCFVLFPFLPIAQKHWPSAVLYAAYGASTMLMMIQCGQTSRDRGINPVFIYGFFAGVVYALHSLGFITGVLGASVQIFGIEPDAIVAIFALYLLGIMFFVAQGSMKRMLGFSDKKAADIELVASSPSAASSPAAKPEKRGEGTEGEPVFRDRIAKQADLLRVHYRLSAREAEVAELIARGNTVPRIAEQLVISENTVRTHFKRIYAKLDIHKKQELLDLIEMFEP